jgi:hypothetical protein
LKLATKSLTSCCVVLPAISIKPESHPLPPLSASINTRVDTAFAMHISDERAQAEDRENCSDAAPPLSINRLIALHSRERLFVHPLCWTDRQLTLLQCRFHDCGKAAPKESDLPPISKEARRWGPDQDEARRAARLLTRPMEWWRWQFTVRDLLDSVTSCFTFNSEYVLHHLISLVYPRNLFLANINQTRSSSLLQPNCVRHYWIHLRIQ